MNKQKVSYLSVFVGLILLGCMNPLSTDYDSVEATNGNTHARSTVATGTSRSVVAGDSGGSHAAKNIGTGFAVSGSGYLDVTLVSSRLVSVVLESIPKIVTYQIESASGPGSTELALAGFEPGGTYYKYEDSYRNLTTFTADGQGRYTYQQDLNSPHLVFIQPHSSTIFLTDTGWSNPAVGTWDSATRTATLTQDVTESIEVQAEGITLDGNHHLLSGSGTGFGVYIPYSGVEATVRNVRIRGFSYGIYVLDHKYQAIPTVIGGSVESGNRIYENSVGIFTAWAESSLEIVGNEIYANGRGVHTTFGGATILHNAVYDNNGEGIRLEWYRGLNHVAHNDIYGNDSGILVWESMSGPSLYEENEIHDNQIGFYFFSHDRNFGNTLRRNTFSNNACGIRVKSKSTFDNFIYNNNFIANTTQVQYPTPAEAEGDRDAHYGNVDYYNEDLPFGGNYWTDWAAPDANGDGLVDVPRLVCIALGASPPLYDHYPWARPNGWLPSPGMARVAVVLKDSALGPLDPGFAEYYDGAWKPFGTTAGGVVIGELPPRTYPIRLRYGSATASAKQDVGVNPLVVFQTVKATVRLIGSFGSPLNPDVIEYYTGAWTGLGPIVDGAASRELLPGTYSFRIKLGSVTASAKQDIGTNNTVTFQTVKATVRLIDSFGSPLNPDVIEYYTGAWTGLGPIVDGAASRELLPGTYSFRIRFSGATASAKQDIGTNNLVTFQTVGAKVRVIDAAGNPLGGRVVEYYNAGWQPIGVTTASGEVSKELLASTWAFRVRSGSSTVSKKQDIGIDPTVVLVCN